MSMSAAQALLASHYPLLPPQDRAMDIYLRLLAERATEALVENDLARTAGTVAPARRSRRRRAQSHASA